MSLNFSVTVDDRELQAKLKRMAAAMKPEAQKAVNVTTAASLAMLKAELPKRTGVLSNSYRYRRAGELTNQIYSPVWYSKEYETGAPRRIIKAKPGKMLVFPISKTGKTAKGLLSYTQVRKYFDEVNARKLNGRKNGIKPLKKVAEELGIHFAKIVRHPGYRGRHVLERVVAPFAKARLKLELFKVFGRLNK